MIFNINSTRGHTGSSLVILIDDVCIGVKHKLLVLVLVLMVDISVKAEIKAISSDTHQLQLIKLLFQTRTI